MTGFRVLRRRRQVGPDVVDRFRTVPVANVSDVMARMAAAGPRLRPLHAAGGLAGPAVTVRTRPGDNLMIHKALDMAVAGDVVVVDGGGDLTNALMGELMLAYAEKKGLAGVVLNGAVRDYGWVRQSRFPLYAAGVTHRGPYKDGPGEVNVIIAVDGMVIEPGDLVLGDEDGLVCVPYDRVEEVHAAATGKHRAEAEQMRAIEEGRNDRAWVDAALTRLGCTIEG